MEDTQKLLNEVKDGVVSELKKEVGVIVADEVKKLENSLKEVKAPSEKQEAAKSLDYFKNKYQKDIFGVAKDMNTGTETAGEELVPEYYGSEVIRVAGEYGVARRNARVINMPGKIYYLPTMGSVTAYRTDEGAKIRSSAPTTGQIKFEAKKLAGMVIVTRELVEDANVDVLSYIAGLAGEAIAQKEDEWAFLGLAGTEGIFRNTDAKVYTLGSGKTKFADVTYDDIGGAMKLLNDSVVSNARVLSSWDIAHGLRMQKDEEKRYILPQSPTAGTNVPFWGLPVINSTVLPKSTDSGSQANKAFAAIYDPRYLMIGDRRSISLEFSREATVTLKDAETTVNLFEQDMVAIKVTERIDVQLAEAAKAFVMLKTAAS